MNTSSSLTSFVRPSLALAVALTLGFCLPLQAQSDLPMHGMPMVTGQGVTAEPAKAMMMGADMIEDEPTPVGSRQAMLERHHAMMAEMKVENAEIATAVAAMNRAPADQKLTLLAAIVTRMVDQRTAMEARLGAMQGEMMMGAHGSPRADRD